MGLLNNCFYNMQILMVCFERGYFLIKYQSELARQVRNNYELLKLDNFGWWFSLQICTRPFHNYDYVCCEGEI